MNVGYLLRYWPTLSETFVAREIDGLVARGIGVDVAAIGARDAALLISYRDSADRSTSIPLHGVGQGATLELVGRGAIGHHPQLEVDPDAADDGQRLVLRQPPHRVGDPHVPGARSDVP